MFYSKRFLISTIKCNQSVHGFRTSCGSTGVTQSRSGRCPVAFGFRPNQPVRYQSTGILTASASCVQRICTCHIDSHRRKLTISDVEEVAVGLSCDRAIMLCVFNPEPCSNPSDVGISHIGEIEMAHRLMISPKPFKHRANRVMPFKPDSMGFDRKHAIIGKCRKNSAEIFAIHRRKVPQYQLDLVLLGHAHGACPLSIVCDPATLTAGSPADEHITAAKSR